MSSIAISVSSYSGTCFKSKRGESMCAPKMFIPCSISLLPRINIARPFPMLFATTLSPALSVAEDAISSSRSANPAPFAFAYKCAVHSLSVLQSEIKLRYASANAKISSLLLEGYLSHAFFFSISITSYSSSSFFFVMFACTLRYSS